MSKRKRLFSPVRRREFEHMESAKSKVYEIDPKTGEYIEPKEVDKKLVVNHHFKREKSPIEPIAGFMRKGILNLTDKEIDRAYEIIKGFRDAQQYS